MWVVGGVVIGAGAIAAIVCFPAEAAALARAAQPHVLRLVQMAIPHIMPLVRSGAQTLLDSSNLPISSAVMALLATIHTQNENRLQQ